MKKIEIQFISHKDQRLQDVGDWQFDGDGNLAIRVSDLEDWKKNCALALHELWEALLCKSDGITDLQVDEWDTNNPDRGDDPEAPYYKQHQIALSNEILFASLVGIDWAEYENQIDEQ